MDLLTAAVILIPTVLGMIIGGKLVHNWLVIRINPLETENLNEIVANYDNDVKILKSEINHWRGKYNSQMHKVKVDFDGSVDNDDSLVSLAKSILPAISEMLPDKIKPHVEQFLKKPEIIDILAEVHKKFPEDTKKILSGFIKNNGKSNTNDDTTKEDENKMLIEQGA